MAERTVPMSELRRRAGALLNEVSSSEEPLYVTLHGRPAVVLLGYDAYEALIAQLEDLADQAGLRSAVNEPARPYEEFVAEMEAGRERA